LKTWNERNRGKKTLGDGGRIEAKDGAPFERTFRKVGQLAWKKRGMFYFQ